MKAIGTQTGTQTQLQSLSYQEDLRRLGIDPKNGKTPAKWLDEPSKDGRLTPERAQQLVRANHLVFGPKVEPRAIVKANRTVRATTMAVKGMTAHLIGLNGKPLDDASVARLKARADSAHKAINNCGLDTLSDADVKLRNELSAEVQKLNGVTTDLATFLSRERDRWLESSDHPRRILTLLTGAGEALAPLSRLATQLGEPAWGSIESARVLMRHPNFEGTIEELQERSGLPRSAVAAALWHRAEAGAPPMEQAVNELRYLNNLEQSRPSAPMPMPWPYLASPFSGPLGFHRLMGMQPQMQMQLPWWMAQMTSLFGWG